MNSTTLEKYANLVVKIGANVQKDQIVVLSLPVECIEFGKLIVKYAYLAGAKNVIVNYNCSEINSYHYQYQSEKTLGQYYQYDIDRIVNPIVNENACRISVITHLPGVFGKVDPKKISISQKATANAILPMRQVIQNYATQWTVVSYPNIEWAKLLFPKLPPKVAFDKLLNLIYKMCLVDKPNPVKEWVNHNTNLHKYADILNKHNFKKLTFKNKLGTNLEICLVKDHIWKAGSKYTSNKQQIEFNPNIPTFETFTMPDGLNVNGKVYSSKPLIYSNQLIDNFWFEFKNGKIVNYGAKKGAKVIEEILKTDEGSSYLGEVALVPYSSPISLSNVVFQETLFDENASCHLAIGNCYPITIVNGTKYKPDELKKHGGNSSAVHIDFMFGTADLSVIGTNQDGKEVPIFVNGNFVNNFIKK